MSIKLNDFYFYKKAIMKNVYNLISDGFKRLEEGENIESNYHTTVNFTETNLRQYDIKIKSKDPNTLGFANLILSLDFNDNLIDYEATNDLFINSNWDLFCSVFERQITISNTLQNYILQYMNNSGQPVEDDAFET
jgi:hypothetical protein